MRASTIAVLVCAMLPLVTVGVSMSSWEMRRSNCGGNSAALSQVRTIALYALSARMDHPDNQLTLADLLSSLQEELPSIIHNHWIPSAHFLVATKPVATVITNQREIIVVCDTTFRNQPRPDSKPAHAVAYSDSSTGLISPQEYEALDLSQFVVLDKLIITK